MVGRPRSRLIKGELSQAPKSVCAWRPATHPPTTKHTKSTKFKIRRVFASRDLANALKGTTSLAAAGYRLQYTAYIDGIRHNSISAETRLPPGTAYHDNFYQRKDMLLKGNSVAGATNINVTQTTWGRQLVHTTIDDNATLQQALVGELMSRMIA